VILLPCEKAHHPTEIPALAQPGSLTHVCRASSHPTEWDCALSHPNQPTYTDTQSLLRNQSQHGDRGLGAPVNRRAHLYRVLVEILLMIFFFCDFAPVPLEQHLLATAAWKHVRLLGAATLVCCRFHAILTGASEFWKVIIFMLMGRMCDTNVVKQMIWHSGERPVHIVWDCKGTHTVVYNACVNALCSVNTSTLSRSISLLKACC